MTTTDVFTVRGSSAEDVAAFAALGARCFKDQFWTYDMIHYVARERLPQYPGFKPEHMRLGSLNGAVVSEAIVLPYPIAYGSATLEAGGIAFVCTDEAHRGKGYASEVMRDAVVYMQADGFDLSFLNSGLEGYYNRFGYADAFPNFNLRVEPPVVEARIPEMLAGDLYVRDLFGDDVPAMLALYSQDYAGRPGARARDLPYLQWKLGWGFPHRRGAFTADGELRGYVAGWGHEWLSEAIVADRTAAAALLRDNAQLMRERESDDAAKDKPFWWGVPSNAPSAAYVRSLCGVATIAYTRPNAGWMARVLNLGSTFGKLLPELEARLTRSMFAGREAALRLETDLGDLTLVHARDRLALDGHTPSPAVARMTQADLTQMMFAAATPAQVALRTGVHIDAAALPLLEALFPPRVSYLAGIDWY